MKIGRSTDCEEGDGSGSSISSGGSSKNRHRSSLTRLLALCTEIATSEREEARAKTGLNEDEYFFGKGEGGVGGEEKREEGGVAGTVLTVLYETFTGEIGRFSFCCNGYVRIRGDAHVYCFSQWSVFFLIVFLQSIVFGDETSAVFFSCFCHHLLCFWLWCPLRVMMINAIRFALFLHFFCFFGVCVCFFYFFIPLGHILS